MRFYDAFSGIGILATGADERRPLAVQMQCLRSEPALDKIPVPSVSFVRFLCFRWFVRNQKLLADLQFPWVLDVIECDQIVV